MRRILQLNVVVVCANSTCLTVSVRPTKFITAKSDRCTPVVSRIFEHHPGDSMILLGSTLILKESTLEVVTSVPLLFLFHQPQERTCRSTAI
ncbi:hypothetical protein TNCV_2885401 [Trichonephila clavipes]|nr:hypothetical protein TNCV_2885401 [Trichonephila clavipes]